MNFVFCIYDFEKLLLGRRFLFDGRRQKSSFIDGFVSGERKKTRNTAEWREGDNVRIGRKEKKKKKILIKKQKNA